MEKNNAEDTKSSEDENESFSLSEGFSITSTINEAVIREEKEKKNEQTIDIDKASTSKETASTSTENEIIDSEQQQNICKTDCNGDPKEESNLEEDTSITTDEALTKESDLQKSCSVVTKSTSERVKQNLFDVDTTRLIEILKIVHDNSGKIKKANNDTLTAVTDDSKDGSKKEQQPITKEETLTEDDAGNSMNESSTSAFEKTQEEKSHSKESLEKTKDNSEVGIVGPPTAATLLINQEELQGDSVISTDQEDHVAEWIEESVKQIAEKEKKFAKAKCKRKIFDQNNTEDMKPKQNKLNNSILISPRFRASQKVIKGIIKRSIKYLNKMHAMEGAVENKKKVNTAEDEKPSNTSPSSSKVPQSQQNGAALPEETATAPTTAMSRVRIKKDTLKKKDSQCNAETPEATKDEQLLASTSRQKIGVTDQRQIKFQSVESLKRRKSTNGQLFAENPRKKLRIDDQREEYILRMVGNDNESVDELMARANQLRSDILALENLQRAKEMEWNDILRKRKLKEEAYTRLERKIRMTVEVENDDQSLPLESSPPHKSSVLSEWENIGNTTSIASKERSLGSKDDLVGERPLDSPIQKKEKAAKVITQQRTTPPKTNGESNRKQNEAMSPESRQIGEGRQGAIVDVRSIIADHRLKHPETVPRRGRRMRSSVNIGLGAGGAMVETGHNTDSRPSSTESCKSTPSADSMNYKDMLVQFAKMSQQGEPVKVPQNYPDVTLHPVAPSSTPQNTSSQSSGSSLLHGILTKTQSPRSTTFSPTLARLLTAPERERNSPAAAAAAVASTSQQSATTQHLLQTYQGSNLVSINDLLSSSKARTEITITPVVNTPAHSHSNDLIPVEDVEEETTSNDDRRGSSASGKQVVKDSPSSPNAAPKCQGCIIRPAQFVCAGCGNQWYCSRTCQLAAWSTHSDYCPPESENGKAKTIV